MSAMQPSPLVAAAGAGTDASIRRFRTRVLVRGDASGGAASVLEHALAPGCVAMPVHRHAACEVLHVLDGALWLWLDGAERRLEAGGSAVVPPDARHTVWVDVDAPAPARFLAVCAPGGMERYYEDVAAHVPDGAAGRGPDMPGVLAAGVRHGVEPDMMSLYDLIARHGLSLA